MPHNHEHSHNESLNFKQVNKAFYFAIILNVAFVIVEFISGFMFNSLSLFTDASHNLIDVTSLFISLGAFKLSQKKATDNFTYGFKKTTILASLINSFILLLTVGSILYEGINRINKNIEVQGLGIIAVASIGIIINFCSALVFIKQKETDLNIKGAYLHLIADAIVSLGVVIAGILIILTKINFIDTITSFIVSIVIIYGTWKLLWQSLKLSIDGVPSNINIKDIEKELLKISNVKEVHHIHIWALSTTENALTLHVVLDNIGDIKQIDKIISEIKHELLHYNVHHSTIEVENIEKNCTQKNC